MTDAVDIVVFVLECIGAIAFTLSGTVISVEHKIDPVGTFVITFTTAFGGGIIRDLMLGITPPCVFSEKSVAVEAVISVTVAMIFYLFAFFRKTSPFVRKIKGDMLLYLLDAVGLSIFCISGAKTAIAAGYGENIPLVVTAAVVSGCGGGILRDVFISRVPMVFRKHVYILPALVGSIAYALLYTKISQLAAMLIGISLIIGIRIPAIKYKWNLPIPKTASDDLQEKNDDDCD